MSYHKQIGVYIIKNKINNKLYIGSSKDIGARWAEHKRDLTVGVHRNRHLQNAWKKYGHENFCFEIVELLSEVSEQFKREQYWIDTFKGTHELYNVQLIVSEIPRETKAVVCLETGEIFKSLEEAGEAKGILPSSISCCCNHRKLRSTGGLHWVFLKEFYTMSEDDITEVINFDPLCKKVICLDTGEIFRSAAATGLPKSAIQNCCKKLADKRYCTVSSRKYMYFSDYNKLTLTEINYLKSMSFNLDRAVRCLETGKVYKSMRDAALKNNISIERLIRVVSIKDAITAGGLHWIYEKDFIKITDQDIEALLVKKDPIPSGKPVVCLETCKTYRSIREASVAENIPVEVIIKSCKTLNTSAPKHFVYLSTFRQMTPEEIENTRTRVFRPKNFRAVRCLETNEIFSKVTEAAKKYGTGTSNISKACKTGKICKGFHWEYITYYE